MRSTPGSLALSPTPVPRDVCLRVLRGVFVFCVQLESCCELGRCICLPVDDVVQLLVLIKLTHVATWDMHRQALDGIALLVEREAKQAPTRLTGRGVRRRSGCP